MRPASSHEIGMKNDLQPHNAAVFILPATTIQCFYCTQSPQLHALEPVPAVE